MAKKEKSQINENFEALKQRMKEQKAAAEAGIEPVDNRVDKPVDNRVDKSVDSRVDKSVDNRVDKSVDTLKLNKKEKVPTKKATYYLQRDIAVQMEVTSKKLDISGSELANKLLEYALGALKIE